MDGVEHGTIARWFSRNGYGFLRGADRKDLFFPARAGRSAPGEFVKFIEGERVVFTRAVDEQGRPHADWVRPDNGREAA